MRRFFLAGFLFLWVAAAVSAQNDDAVFSFKGNTLGMSLSDFKASNNQGVVSIAWGQPNWRGQPKKGNEKQVPTPLCTDQLHGFPGDDEREKPGEILCNPAPGEINLQARVVAGAPVSSVIYRFYNGRLYEIDLTFAAIRYSVIRAAFEEKYGQPSIRKSLPYQNGYGARWEGEILGWQRGAATLVIDEGGKDGPGQDKFDPVASSSASFKDDSLGPPASTPRLASDF